MNISVVLAILTAFSMASGQLLFKLGADKWRGDSVVQLTRSFLSSPYLMGAVFLYALTILVWIYVLKTLPLSIAYPLTALSYILVPVFSLVILGEKISINTMIGSGLIIAGVIVAHVQKV